MRERRRGDPETQRRQSMVPVEYHSSTGLNAGNQGFLVHHLNSQEPESATFTSVYALADACTSTVPISRRTFSDLLSARRGGGGGFNTKVVTCALVYRHFSKCQATAGDQVYRLPVPESRFTNGKIRSARLRSPYGMMHSTMRQRKKLSSRQAEESLWKHYC